MYEPKKVLIDKICEMYESNQDIGHLSSNKKKMSYISNMVTTSMTIKNRENT